MQRRRFSREFKLEAVKLVRERGLSAAQAARDLDGRERLRREVNKLKAERDILKKAAAFFAREATGCKACSAVRRYAFCAAN